MSKKVLCILGPTASGKTQLAFDLYDYYKESSGCDLISVDSAMIYNQMDIGTAKPTDTELKKYPHALVNIKNPDEIYSAGDFYNDAKIEIKKSLDNNRTPILVGGTMMYYNSLFKGLSDLPKKDDQIREKIELEAKHTSWEHLHIKLSKIDPTAANKINKNDTQRITRALEIYEITGKGISHFWEQEYNLNKQDEDKFEYIIIGLDLDRELLHQRIEQRFDTMLENNFLDEVKKLMQIKNLTCEHPAMKSVGYRQAWNHLSSKLSNNDDISFDEFKERALVATRRLAKHQCTWMRSFSKSNYNFKIFDVTNGTPIKIIKIIKEYLKI